jgi:hypothetical protein
MILGKEIVDAIKFLRPNSNFTMIGDNLDSIIWLDVNSSIPTLQEIEQAKLTLLNQAEIKEAARQAVLDKLGLTAEDIAALGL